MRYTTDTNNNIGRRCDVMGRKDRPARDFTVRSAVKDELTAGSVTHYAVVDSDGREYVVRRDLLTNLY